MCTLSWQSFLNQLRAVEKLLVRVYAREQFMELCVPEIDHPQLASWKADLKGLRWEAITHFCQEVFWLSTGRLAVLVFESEVIF